MKSHALSTMELRLDSSTDRYCIIQFEIEFKNIFFIKIIAFISSLNNRKTKQIGRNN